MVEETKLAWLAGVWDGEGSVSSFFTSPTNAGPKVQMSMTCGKTIFEIIKTLKDIGVSALGYTYQEKKSHHKDAHYIRVNRVNDVLTMGKALVSYSVTKRAMWELAIEMCEIKMSRRRVMPDGRLSKGGKPMSPLTEREFEIANLLREMNYRKKEGE